MIGKVMKGKSFRGCLLYVMNDKVPGHEDELVMKNRAEVLVYNECYGNTKELIEQFNDVRKLNQNVSKPVLHITLSMSPGERITNDQLADMSRDCATAFGFEKNQYVAILHKDSNHQHIHLVANRIGFDGKTVSDSHNYRTMARLSRKLEVKHSLKQVLSPRRYLSREERLIPRIDERKLQIKQCIEEQLRRSSTLREFVQRMKEKGYQVAIGRGISFTDPKQVKIKGSELNYSLKTIEAILERQQIHQPKQEQTQKQSQILSIDSGKHQREKLRIPDHSKDARQFMQRQEAPPDELKHDLKKKRRIKLSR